MLVRRHDGTFKAPQRYSAGDTPLDVIAREDLDGDGDRDLAAANYGSGDVSVRLGRGDGTFSAQRRYDAGSGVPTAIESGDMDGDGDKDLVTANSVFRSYGTVSVFLNRGDGLFAPAREFLADRAYPAEDVDRSDLDGDGDEDLVVAMVGIRGGLGGLSVLTNDGDGAFGAPQEYEGVENGQAVIADDLDGDGDNDLAAADSGGENVAVYKNDGGGVFALEDRYYVFGGEGSPPADGPVGLTEADFDRDGDVDLATANANTDNVSVLTNRGDGTFGPYDSARVFGAGDGPAGITRARTNADRKPDLVVANSGSDNVSVLANTTQP